MANALSAYYPVLRALLSDSDADIPIYDPAVIDGGIAAVVNLGKVRQPGIDGSPGSGDPYVVDLNASTITPSLTPASDLQAYTALIWHAAKVFAVALTSSSFRTRGFSETIGDSHELIVNILNEVYQLESGDGCS